MLSILIFLPLAGGVLATLMPNADEDGGQRAGLVSLRLIRRFPRLHGFLEHKWYFDEVYDALIVRPILATGQALSNVFERVVIDGMMTGAAQAVRGGNSVVRAVQSGLLRNYALLLVTGVTALALYFLVVSR